ncbi:hypothetical protein [Luteipulveratus mongoliensis]|uniref:Uncharacterized protein n=1 Tax=Luteipulveratus mongoliensis TaxID=571913 RepID=A0A0K1JNY6_9MICO|nr:hypothetical protein [Luteipulveratus mongoliensis]AKU18298.1 hypothetical protein VV02_24730 [Luteipulveratus mongoliensis]
MMRNKIAGVGLAFAAVIVTGTGGAEAVAQDGPSAPAAVATHDGVVERTYADGTRQVTDTKSDGSMVDTITLTDGSQSILEVSAPMEVSDPKLAASGWKERRWKTQRHIGSWWNGPYWYFNTYGSWRYNGSQMISGDKRCGENGGVGYSLENYACYRERQRNNSMDTVDKTSVSVLVHGSPVKTNKWSRTRSWVSGSIQRFYDGANGNI